MSYSLLVFLGGLAAVVVWAILVYNRLVLRRNEMDNAFAQIDVQLKRRHDLVPNLVNTARGYLQHERQTLEAITVARGRASQAREAASAASQGGGRPELLEALDRAESGLASARGTFSVIVEAYPELKADGTIAQLTEELTSTENRIGFSRQAFNDVVNRYNDSIGQFPDSLVAGAFGFARAGFLRSTRSAVEREPVVVQLT